MKLSRLRMRLCAITLVFLTSDVAWATPYTYSNLADNTGFLSELGVYFSANNKGAVAFAASIDTGGDGVFSASNGSITTIASMYTHISAGGQTSINNDGTVAFIADFGSGADGVFRGSGGPLGDPIYSEASPLEVRVNDSGLVAVIGRNPNSGSFGIFVGNGGLPTTIFDYSDRPNDGYGYGFGDYSFNNSGEVAFVTDDVIDTIFTGNGGPLTTIADNTNGQFADVQGAVMSDSGTVVFEALTQSGVLGLFRHDGGVVGPIIDDTELWSGDFYPFALNNNGLVAFEGRTDYGLRGLFVGPNPILDKVIAIGDPLFGSVVESFGFCSTCLNDSGGLTFLYELSNGVDGYALATPVPEPSTLSLFMLGVLVTVFGTCSWGMRWSPASTSGRMSCITGDYTCKLRI